MGMCVLPFRPNPTGQAKIALLAGGTTFGEPGSCAWPRTDGSDYLDNQQLGEAEHDLVKL